MLISRSLLTCCRLIVADLRCRTRKRGITSPSPVLRRTGRRRKTRGTRQGEKRRLSAGILVSSGIRLSAGDACTDVSGGCGRGRPAPQRTAGVTAQGRSDHGWGESKYIHVCVCIYLYARCDAVTATIYDATICAVPGVWDEIKIFVWISGERSREILHINNMLCIHYFFVWWLLAGQNTRPPIVMIKYSAITEIQVI